MPDLLYLDTARLGRMSPTARLLHHDFADMAGAEGASPRFERFLQHGVQALPQRVAERYPGLAGWQGLGELKRALRTLAGSRSDLPVLVANRSAELMQFAARLLCRPCSNILVTDLGWPPYHSILERACQRTGRSLTTVALRQAVLGHAIGEEELVDLVCREFAQSECDGLFLTAVSHLGVRLPVERIVRALEAAHHLWFVVIDGAQDFCHASADLRNEYCDLYLSGCHKWLRAYYPMGLGFYGRRRSRGNIAAVLENLLSAGELDDPLLTFSGQLETDRLEVWTETVNLASLFSCQGAIADALAMPRLPVDHLLQQKENASVLAERARSVGWRPVLPAETFRTGILLLQAERVEVRGVPAAELRTRFGEQEVALTAYEEGMVRLSMPTLGWQAGAVECLQNALRSVG